MAAYNEVIEFSLAIAIDELMSLAIKMDEEQFSLGIAETELQSLAIKNDSEVYSLGIQQNLDLTKEL